jgi:apolipoprotein D and lipocalin family protein
MMGDWYVQAGRFTFLEKEVHDGRERYTWNEEKKRIDINYVFRKGGFDGPRKEYNSRAWIEDPQTPARWKFQMLWPITLDQLIIALDEDYRWTVVGVPNQKYVWIMSRDPQFPRSEVDAVIERVKALGYDMSEIVYVPHSQQ